MNIALIGATGMIGHHTARALLQRGHELTIVHRQSSNLEQVRDLQFNAVVADLDSEQQLAAALSGVDAVINCAGYYPTRPRAWRDEVATATGQMENFYRACAAHGKLQKIVYLGAAIALRRHPDGEPGHADLEYPSQPDDRNPYLQVKWAMDRQAKQQASAGLPVVIGIPSMTFGEYDYGPTTGQLLTGIANRTLPGYVQGNRNVIYAGDAGMGLALACERGKPGERYLFTGENVSMDELVARIARLTGVPPLKTIPLPMAKLVSNIQAWKYRLLGGELPRVSSTAIAVMSAGQFLDGSKARDELGFRTQVSLDQALERTLEWFRSAGYIR